MSKRVRSSEKTSNNSSTENLYWEEDDDDLEDFISLHEDDIQIDENDLNGCLTRQSSSYYEVSKRLALETSRRDAAKINLKETESRADLALRSQAKQTGTKMTETELASRRQVDDDVMEAEALLRKCTERMRALEALEKSFSQRVFILRDLCQLWIASYYGDSGDGITESAVKSVKAEQNKKVLQKKRKS